MKLATLRDGSRDGVLAVVSRDLSRCTPASTVAPTLQAALDDWGRAEGELRALAARLDGSGDLQTQPFRPEEALAPLPRAYEWLDGSAFLNHVRLVRRARGAQVPPTLETDPLVYQGGSGCLLGPTDDAPLPDPSWGLDFEGEVVVVLGDVAQGATVEEAAACVRLVGIANDLSYRELIPGELAKSFGFVQSKPATAFSPVFCTPDELGPAWREGRLHRPLRVALNGEVVGEPEGGEMHFSFFELIAHIAKTRSFTAGTILGSGTVSNEDVTRGISCLAERRMLEIIEHGEPRTPWLKHGDRVRIEMHLPDGTPLFGAIDQKIQSPTPTQEASHA